jgi:hypothetical protein
MNSNLFVKYNLNNKKSHSTILLIKLKTKYTQGFRSAWIL